MNHDYENIISRIKDEVNLRDIIEGAGIALDKRGFGKCPFHADDSPSFHIVERGPDSFYKCFGCDAGGDVITFFMKSQNLPFWESVKELAQRTGIPLPILSKEQKEAADKESKRRDVLTACAEYWHQNCPDEVQGWLIARFGEEVFKKEKLGFCYREPDQMISIGQDGKRGRNAPPTMPELAEFGLLATDKQTGRVLEPPRWNGCLSGRITFPDWRGGRIRFLWTRTAPDAPDGGRDTRPKYLPYIATGGAPLINLTGLHGHEIWLTEGISKVYTLKRLEIEAVGLPGVGGLSDHFGEFAKADRIWILFDNDAAGRKFAWKYAKQFGNRARVVELPPAKDASEGECGTTGLTDKGLKPLVLKDISDYVEVGIIKNRADVEALADLAKTWVQKRIADAGETPVGARRNDILSEILPQVSELPPLEYAQAKDELSKIGFPKRVVDDLIKEHRAKSNGHNQGEDLLELQTDFKKFSPAMDYHKGVLYLGVIVPVNAIKDDKQIIEEKLYLVNSSREYFALDQQTLYRRGLSANLNKIAAFKCHWKYTGEFGIFNWIKSSEGKIDPLEIYAAVRKYFTDHCWFPHDEYHDILSLFVFCSYFTAIFDSVPYIYLNATREAGKSLTMDIIADLGLLPGYDLALLL